MIEFTFIQALPLLFVGFGLGLMHALDADHIMAVSMLNNQNPSVRKMLFHSAHWALGHGGVLLMSGALLFGLGVGIPETLQHLAELSVGALLIALGIVCFYRIRKDKLSLVLHSHGDVVHAHWCEESRCEESRNEESGNGEPGRDQEKDRDHKNSLTHEKQHVHKPVFIGILHGLAGSAPALALIPAVAQGHFAQAMLYLVLFSMGVMLSMVAFGLGFAQIQHTLMKSYQKAFQISRYLLALCSIGLGSFWLISAV